MTSPALYLMDDALDADDFPGAADAIANGLICKRMDGFSVIMFTLYLLVTGCFGK